MDWLVPWLSPIGLGCDFIGVLFLVFEWREAFQDALKHEVGRRATAGKIFIGAHGAGKERSELEVDVEKYFRPRKRLYTVGLIFILVGFALQFIGSIPIWPQNK